MMIDEAVCDVVWRAGLAPSFSSLFPANTRYRPNVGPMMSQRRRRWLIIGTALGRCLVFAGSSPLLVA